MKKTPFIYLFLMAGLLPALPAGAQPLTLMRLLMSKTLILKEQLL